MSISVETCGVTWRNFEKEWFLKSFMEGRVAYKKAEPVTFSSSAESVESRIRKYEYVAPEEFKKIEWF